MATIIKDLLNKNSDIVHPRTEDNAVLDGGVSLYSRLRAGTSGQVFMSNGANAPSWQTLDLDYIKIPETIPASSDLNTYQTAGFYYCPANATAATLSNCPTTSAFSLLVEKHAGVKQTLTIYLTNNISTWIRNKYSTTWGTWYQILNATGKAVDADKLDGNDSTYFSTATHVHGNISNAGLIGTTANLPLITGTAGIVQTSSFGNSANTFCQGNDARLSNSRPASDVSAWAKEATKPSYGWDEIGSKPSTFTPSAHDHSWVRVSDIRTTNPTPDATQNNAISTFFNDMYGDTWRSGITVSGWSTGYQVWQLAAPSSNADNEGLFFRVGRGTTWSDWRTILTSANYTSYTVTKTGTGASGTWPISITGTAADSSKLNGVASAEASTVSTIAKRNASGDLNVRLIREEYANQSTISGGIVFRVNNTTDNYLRVCNSVSAIRTFLDVPDTSHTHSYQPTITYGTGNPDGGSVGDVYIKWS